MKKDLEDYQQFLAEFGITEEWARARAEITSDMVRMPDERYPFHLDVSGIEGLGVFATVSIAAGAIVGPGRIGAYRTILGRYCNHARKPNAKMIETPSGVSLVATVEIAPHEEITTDYRDNAAANARQLGLSLIDLLAYVRGEFREWEARQGCVCSTNGRGTTGACIAQSMNEKDVEVAATSFPEKVKDLEAAMLASGKPVVLEPVHHFCKGMYARQLFIPAGTLITGKVHKHEHIFLLLKGDVSLVSEDGTVFRVKAPFFCVSPPGTKRIAYHHEDTVGMNIHVNPTDTHDLAEIESNTVCDSIEDYQKFVEMAAQIKLEGV